MMDFCLGMNVGLQCEQHALVEDVCCATWPPGLDLLRDCCSTVLLLPYTVRKANNPPVRPPASAAASLI